MSGAAPRAVSIGVLGFQGDIEENVAATSQAIEDLGIDGSVKVVRYPGEIKELDGLVMPGGESTVQSALAAIQQSLPVLKEKVSAGMPVLGTCAGMILLSKRAFDRVVGDTKQKLLGSLDIVIERNAFGRQNDSFEADISVPAIGSEPFRGVFIRAPAVSEVGAGVQVMSRFNDRVVAVRQNNVIGTAFHPELASDSRVHRELVRMAVEYSHSRSGAA